MSDREGQVVALIFVVLVFAVAPIIVGARLAEKRGRSVWFGIVLTFVLGWIGVLAVLLSGRRQGTSQGAPMRTRPCPGCGAAVPAAAGSCPACGVVSPAWTMHGGRWWSRDDAGEWRYLDDTRGAWVSPADGSTQAAPAPAAAPLATGARMGEGAAGAAPFVGIDHVQVAAPPGREFDARRFYSGLVGLEEIDKPPLLAARGGCWFRVGAQELHVGTTEDFAPATKAHPALRLRSTHALEEVADRLSAAGYEVTWAEEAEVPGVRRLHVHDPFGNRLELVA